MKSISTLPVDLFLRCVLCKFQRSSRLPADTLHGIGKLVGVAGIEPATSSLSGTRSNQLSYTPGCAGGGNGIRTRDFQLAKLALYQLSYAPGLPAAARPAFLAVHALLSKQKRQGKFHSLRSRIPAGWPFRASGPARGFPRTIVRIFRARVAPLAGDSP